ncbi:MAG: TadE/TadG family type IV pilus assembly protein, partial [Phycisphaerae bacterium]
MACLKMRESRRGTATLETALVLPLLLLLTFALIEYGWLFLRAQEITNGARQGARIAVRPDATNADVQASITAAMETAGIAGYLVTFSP